MSILNSGCKNAKAHQNPVNLLNLQSISHSNPVNLPNLQSIWHSNPVNREKWLPILPASIFYNQNRT